MPTTITINLSSDDPKLAEILAIIGFKGSAAAAPDKSKFVAQAHPPAENVMPPMSTTAAAPAMPAPSTDAPPSTGRGRKPDSPEVKADKAAAKAAGVDYKEWVARKAAAQPVQPAQVAAAHATNGTLPASAPAPTGIPGMPPPAVAAEAPADPLIQHLKRKFDQVSTTHAGKPFGMMLALVPSCFKVDQFPVDKAPQLLEQLYGIDQTPV